MVRKRYLFYHKFGTLVYVAYMHLTIVVTVR